MRILQVGSGLHDWGGIERYVVYLTEAQRQLGDEVAVTLPPGSPLARRIHGGHLPLSVRRQLELRAIGRYVRLFRRSSFDVINVHFSRDYLNVGVAAKLCRVREVVMTRHLAIRWKPKSVRKYTRLYDGFLGVSDAVRQKLIESGVPASRVVAALSGAPSLRPESSREEARAKFGMNGFCAVFVGRMVEDKGPQLLAPIAEQFGEGTIHAFGDGPLLAKLKANAGSVVWQGSVTEPDEAMLAADAILIPSQWDEAFGYVALEAMSLARPVIAANSGGLAEIFRPNQDGILVDRGDPQAYAGALGQLVSAPELALRLGQSAFDRKAAHFEPEHMAQRVRDAYDQLRRR